MIQDPTDSQQQALHKFYLSTRELVSKNIVPVRSVQRSLEEVIAGFAGENNWRPTHISHAAVKDLIESRERNVQRAHGALKGRLDRFDRALELLIGPERSFEEWWKFYVLHDSTVLITRAEHGQNKIFEERELIPIPQDSRNMFANSGFKYKVRKNVELLWLKNYETK